MNDVSTASSAISDCPMVPVHVVSGDAETTPSTPPPQKPSDSMANHSSKSRPVAFLFEYSIFLIVGALAALIWANADAQLGTDTYHHFVHFELRELFVDNGESEEHDASEQHADAPAEPEAADRDRAADGDGATAAIPPSEHESGPPSHASESDASSHAEVSGASHGLTVHFLINDILMALFFAIAAKEVWEALLPGGALSNPRKAATPLMATLGGIAGPALLYLFGAWTLGVMDTLGRGWAVPCATDIAFSYLIARLIFGSGHPAIAFLLLLAIADDAAGLIILAVFYPSGELNLWWLLATLAAVALGFLMRKLRVHSFWWYLVGPGVLSWISFYEAGIHPALGLVPIIPTLPHAHTDLGIFVREELKLDDTLNAFEHWWKNKVEVILGLFGLVNAGVVMSNVGPGTWLVLLGLLVGKPLGITLFSWMGEKLFGLEIPGGMGYRHIVTLGMVAGIGFTVALFVSTAAFTQPGPVQDSVKMGALGSFAAALIAYAMGRMLGIRPLKPQTATA